MQISSYSKIYAMGHRYLSELLLDPVLVEEKVDGSQFSFANFNGELYCQSKGAVIDTEDPNKLFKKAVDYVKNLHKGGCLPEGLVFRAEALCGPRHNTLTYERPPECGMVLFDVCDGNGTEEYFTPDAKAVLGGNLGIPIVPVFFHGRIETPQALLGFLERESFLGGAKIEGFVVKNYARFGVDKKTVMGKFVSEAFKEKHAERTGAFCQQGSNGILEELGSRYCTEARWQKAVQRFRDDGKLEGDPRDIGPLLKLISTDVFEEEKEEIKEALFKWAWKPLSRNLTKGFPQWYKVQLLKGQPAAEALPMDEVFPA